MSDRARTESDDSGLRSWRHVPEAVADGRTTWRGRTVLRAAAVLLAVVAVMLGGSGAAAGSSSTAAGTVAADVGTGAPNAGSIPGDAVRKLSCPSNNDRMIVKSETKTVLSRKSEVVISADIEEIRGSDQYVYCPSDSVDTAELIVRSKERMDADLYVTLDGRRASTTSYDRRSASGRRGATEKVVVDLRAEGEESYDLSPETAEIQLQVLAYDGAGEYVLIVREKGGRPGDVATPDGGTPTSGGEVGDFQATITTNATAVGTGEPVEFRATSTGGGDVTYRWSFGDGTTATGKTVTHAYGSRGSYTVELTATKPDGTTDTATKQILVGTVASSGGGSGGTSTTTVVAGAGGAAVLGGVAYFLFKG